MNVMIYGAGQAGQMVSRWLPKGQELTAFIDNNPALQGTSSNGVRILSQEIALKEKPDLIWLAVLNREARREISDDLAEKGYVGEVEDASRLRSLVDLRLAALRLLAEQIRARGVKGETAELGVYQGAFAAEINRELPDRGLFLFDTFTGFAAADLDIEREKASDGRNARAQEGDFSDTSVEAVTGALPYSENAWIVRGRFPESLSGGAVRASEPDVRIAEEELRSKTFALVSLDTDLYEPTDAGLRFFYPRMESGGALLIHDYHSAQYPGVGRAVDAFCSEHGIFVTPIADLHGTAVLIKQSPPVSDNGEHIC